MKYQRIYIVIAFLMSFASVLYAYDGEANNSVMATFADAPNGNTNIVASGECGEHATWSLDEDGKLTIGGYGDMYNYGRNYDEGLAPWLTSYAKIKSIEISGGITAIGDNTFGLGSYTTATIDVSSIILPDGIKRIGKNAFNMCKSISSIIIPNSVTLIDDRAFLNLENLTSVELSNSLISIGRAAFSSTGIDNIELPNSLTSIGDDAFDYCENLSKIAIPCSVVSIGADAFYECTNLKNITNYADQPQNITSDTFHGVTDATLHVKKGCKKEYANAVVWKNFSIVEDADESVNISKIVDTILKRNGASESMSDVNNDGIVSIADVVYAIDSNKKNVHEYVDLGLSVKWATCNVGASKPEDYGGYYAWGETEEKSTYDWSTYKWCNGTSSSFLKYTTRRNDGIVDYKSILEPEDDVAHIKWGGNWRMPTKAEMDELRNNDNCTWTWTSQNGVNGYRVTSLKNGNSIFLPAAGYHINNTLPTSDYYGYYWSKSLYSSSLKDSYILYFLDGEIASRDFNRDVGLSVRPVYDDAIYVSSIAFDDQSIAMIIGEEKSIGYTVFPSDAANKGIYWSSSNSHVATVSNGIVTARGAGTCTIKATAIDGSGVYCECTVDVSLYVDLALPSGIKWAACNVGATKPEDCGGLYAWGETEEKSEYSWSTYKWCNGTYDTLTKYCRSSYYGNVDNKQILELEDDVSYVKWGKNWHKPTQQEYYELCSNCSWDLTTLNGVKGYKLTSRINGKSIFLPYTKIYDDDGLSTSNIAYWTNVCDIYKAGVILGVNYYGPGYDRSWGLPVRPVYDDPDAVHVIAFDLSSYYLIVGSKYTINYTIEPSNAANKELIWSSNDDSVATVADGVITAKGVGSCTIRATAADGSEVYRECTVHVEPAYEYIDLGLSVKWATCNVGAERPEDYGGYYAWGETEEKSTYDWSTYKWCNGTDNTMTKYCNTSNYGFFVDKSILELNDDVAHVKLGANWRMPTKVEMKELIDKSNCTWTWTTRNGVNGYKVTSLKNENSIFLPAAGYRRYSNLSETGTFGYYWSSSLYESDLTCAYSLYFHSNYYNDSRDNRYCGIAIRPVCPY